MLWVAPAPCRLQAWLVRPPEVGGRRGLLHWLQVGGRLVYSTCTFNPVEDEAVVAEVLSHSKTLLHLPRLHLHRTLLLSCTCVDVCCRAPSSNLAKTMWAWKVYGDVMQGGACGRVQVLRRTRGCMELVDVSAQLPELKRLPGLHTWVVKDHPRSGFLDTYSQCTPVSSSAWSRPWPRTCTCLYMLSFVQHTVARWSQGHAASSGHRG